MSKNRPIGFREDPRAKEPTEQQPEPCEYCSLTANALKIHDGSCDVMTEQEWRELKGEGVGDE